MSCIFCGKVCTEAGVEGEYGKDVAEGRIVGHTHICLDCLAELKDILDIEEIEKKLAETEYEIYEESTR